MKLTLLLLFILSFMACEKDRDLGTEVLKTETFVTPKGFTGTWEYKVVKKTGERYININMNETGHLLTRFTFEGQDGQSSVIMDIDVPVNVMKRYETVTGKASYDQNIDLTNIID